MNQERPTLTWIVCTRGQELDTARMVRELRAAGIDARVMVDQETDVNKLMRLIKQGET